MAKQVVVVTGGTGGIGSAISLRFASNNYHVVACYYKNGKHNDARQWQKQHQQAGFDIDILYADITKYDDCESMASLMKERYGRVDVLVNNAGLTADASLKKMTPEQWHQVLDANLTGVFNVTKNILPLMLAQEYGRIISISSINGHQGQFGQCNYAATKAALLGFSKSLALEVATKGITVNTISPGYIQTSMLNGVNADVLNQIIKAIPMGRLGTPEEVAAGVLFLASPEAAFITGTNLDINGGQYR